MRNLSTITMAILCVMLVAACQKETPDPGIGWEASDPKTKNIIEDVEKEIKELQEALEEALEEASFEELNKKRREAFVLAGDLNEEIIRKKFQNLQEDWTGRVKKNLVKNLGGFLYNFFDLQAFLGKLYDSGKNYKEALKWYEKAAKNGNAKAQYNMGEMYYNGRQGVDGRQGVEKNERQAFRLLLLAAQQNFPEGQYLFGRFSYEDSIYEEAYYWYNLASKKLSDSPSSYGDVDTMRRHLKAIEDSLNPEKINELRKLTGDGWKPRQFVASGSGFFISKEYILTNAHVVCSNYPASPCEPYDEVRTDYYRLKTEKDKIDIDVDLALLKVVSVRKESNLAKIRSASAKFGATSTSALQLGEDIAVFGYPLAEVLSFGGNFTIGNVSAREGRPINVTPSDFFQFTAPIQRGNSGGPVLDAAGNVVGVAVSNLSVSDIKGWHNIAQNINFAVSLKAIKNFLKKAKVEPYASSWDLIVSQSDWDLWEKFPAPTYLEAMDKFIQAIKKPSSEGKVKSYREGKKEWIEVADIAEDFTVPILCFKEKE